MIKVATIKTRVRMIKTLTMVTTTKREHTLTKVEMFTTDTMMSQEIGLIPVVKRMTRVSTKGIGMITINGLTQVVPKIKIMIINKLTLNWITT